MNTNRNPGCNLKKSPQLIKACIKFKSYPSATELSRPWQSASIGTVWAIKVKTRVGFHTRCTKSHTAYVTGTQHHQALTEEGGLFPPGQAGLFLSRLIFLKTSNCPSNYLRGDTRPGVCLRLFFFWSKATFLNMRVNRAVCRWRFKESEFELWVLWLNSDGINSWDRVSERVILLSDWWILGHSVSQFGELKLSAEKLEEIQGKKSHNFLFRSSTEDKRRFLSTVQLLWCSDTDEQLFEMISVT